jgi:hypothetical protein
MSPSSQVVHDAGTVEINDQKYRLVRQGEDARSWRRESMDEPPWTDGAPGVLTEMINSWHGGGLKSRSGMPNTSEYGEDTDGRWPGKLMSAPFNFLLSSNDFQNVKAFFEYAGYLFTVGNSKVCRIDPSDDSVTLSKNFTTGKLLDGVAWEGNGYVTHDDPSAGGNTLWKISAIGSPDTWTQIGASTDFAYRIAAGPDRLFKVNGDGVLENCGTGLDPATVTNWADSVQMGQAGLSDNLPTSLVAYEKSALVGRPEGVFGVGAEGKGVPLIKRMHWDAGNCRGMKVVEPHVWVPHSRGIYRWQPGFVESIGIETELLNESHIRGRFRSFAIDNQWVFGWLDHTEQSIGSIMVSRDRRSGEPGFGPLIWDTLTYLENAVSNETEGGGIHMSRLWNPTRMFAAEYTNVIRWFFQSEGGGAPDVAGGAYYFYDTATRYTSRIDFGDLGDKDFPKINVVGEDCDSTHYWDVAYRVDQGSWITVDIDGANMRVNSDGLTTFYLARTAVGKDIQYRLTYDGPGFGETAKQAGKIRYLEAFAVPRSRKIPVLVLNLTLGQVRHDMGEEHRSTVDQVNDLLTLEEKQDVAIEAKGPWGDYWGWIRRVRLSEVKQEGRDEPELVAEVVIQRREQASADN